MFMDKLRFEVIGEPSLLEVLALRMNSMGQKCQLINPILISGSG